MITLPRFTPRARRLAAYVAVVVIGTLGLWRVETTANNAEATAAALKAEVEARRVASCEQSLNNRTEQERLLVDIVNQFGARPQIVEAIRLSYRELPTPVNCDPRPSRDRARPRGGEP